MSIIWVHLELQFIPKRVLGKLLFESSVRGAPPPFHFESQTTLFAFKMTSKSTLKSASSELRQIEQTGCTQGGAPVRTLPPDKHRYKSTY